MDPKPLEDFLSQVEKNQDQVMCVHVVATLPILKYTKRDGTKASMFTATVADQKTEAKVIVYDVCKCQLHQPCISSNIRPHALFVSNQEKERHFRCVLFGSDLLKSFFVGAPTQALPPDPSPLWACTSMQG